MYASIEKIQYTYSSKKIGYLRKKSHFKRVLLPIDSIIRLKIPF